MSGYLELEEKLGRGVWWKVRNSRIMRKANGQVFCKRVQGGLDKTGIPDIEGVYSGRYVGFEVKAGKGLVSESQKGFKALVEAQGGFYFVVRGIDDVVAALTTIESV